MFIYIKSKYLDNYLSLYVWLENVHLSLKLNQLAPFKYKWCPNFSLGRHEITLWQVKMKFAMARLSRGGTVKSSAVHLETDNCSSTKYVKNPLCPLKILSVSHWAKLITHWLKLEVTISSFPHLWYLCMYIYVYLVFFTIIIPWIIIQLN